MSKGNENYKPMRNPKTADDSAGWRLLYDEDWFYQ